MNNLEILPNVATQDNAHPLLAGWVIGARERTVIRFLTLLFVRF